MVMVSSQAFRADEHTTVHSTQPSEFNLDSNSKSDLGSDSKKFSCEQEFNLKNIESLKFVMQIIITVFMLGMCWSELKVGDNNTRALYWGGLTGIVGWWIPSPGGFGSPTSSDSKKAQQ